MVFKASDIFEFMDNFIYSLVLCENKVSISAAVWRVKILGLLPKVFARELLN